ncbi:MAG: hypothetical protein M0Q93_09140, partial [Terrimicrobiaceae bacterium]|nr:hypothetical protein [Terrimicrobiaceae bacterium]
MKNYSNHSKSNAKRGTRVPDAYGHTASETVTLGGNATSSISQTWDAAGRRESLNTGSGFQPVFGHNAAGQ